MRSGDRAGFEGRDRWNLFLQTTFTLIINLRTQLWAPSNPNTHSSTPPKEIHMKLLVLYATIFINFSTAVAAQTGMPKVEEQVTSTKESAPVFGLFLGSDKLADIELKVQHPDGSICKIIRSKDECRPTYEIKISGYLRNRGNSVYISKYSEVSPSITEVLFTKFSVDGEHLTGTFYKNALIALSVTDKYGDDLDTSVDTAALMASFDKKYKKQGSPFIKTSNENGVTYKDTYHRWRDSTGTFEIHLTRKDEILVNKIACLQHLRNYVSIPSLYNRLKYRCEGSTVSYQLDYRTPELYMQAFEYARQLEASEEAKKQMPRQTESTSIR